METAFGMLLWVGTYAWKFRVSFSEGQKSVSDQIVLKTPAEMRRKKLESQAETEAGVTRSWSTCRAASLLPQISSHPWPSGPPGSEGANTDVSKALHFSVASICPRGGDTSTTGHTHALKLTPKSRAVNTSAYFGNTLVSQ